MGETDLQLGGGYRYQWECAILLALNYFFDPVRYNPTLFDLINDFLGGMTAIHLEGEDREKGVELEDVNLSILITFARCLCGRRWWGTCRSIRSRQAYNSNCRPIGKRTGIRHSPCCTSTFPASPL